MTDYIDALKARPPASETVKRYLDLSIGHLKAATRDQLTLRQLEHVTFMTLRAYRYGAFASMPALDQYDVHEQARRELPEDLFRCLVYAYSQGCELIRFDADGHTVSGLPTYD